MGTRLLPRLQELEAIVREADLEGGELEEGVIAIRRCGKMKSDMMIIIKASFDLFEVV